MKPKSKTRRQKNKQSGKAAVAYFNSRNNRVIVTKNIQVNMTGRNANNTVPITPAPPAKETTPIFVRTVTPQKPVQKPQHKITLWGWAAILLGIAGVAGGAYAGYHHYKKTA